MPALYARQTAGELHSYVFRKRVSTPMGGWPISTSTARQCATRTASSGTGCAWFRT